MIRRATFSPDGRYRYTLERSWPMSLYRPVYDGDRVAWVMLNPSIADGDRDDLTVTKCVRFSKRWGYGELVIVNLYAAIATDPLDLLELDDPIGPENEKALELAVRSSSSLVAAWGATIHELERRGLGWPGRELVAELASRHGCAISSLGVTRDGHPRHPSRVGYETPRTPYLIGAPC